ncbi:MAG: trypsin-like peptidase domain-containing protein [bacterium]|nr:trypsin-like peptidase domain-containing protein [bacterium]
MLGISIPFFLISALAEDLAYLEGSPKLKAQFVPVPSFSQLANELGDSVVNIAVESKNEEVQQETEIIPGLPFKFKGGGGDVSSLGSGFIISKDGFIVTNNHVIDKGDKVIVRLLEDKNEYVAKIIGADPKTDLALIKIEPNKELKPVYFGNSDSINVGDWVLAIGNQFQLGQTVTAGIVSAKSRRVPRGGPYDHFIQTDASINPGSSGGPLFNTEGQVVGINTAIFSPGKTQFGGTGFNIGIGFSVPINIAKRVIVQLKSGGTVIRGWLGVIIQPVTPEVSAVFGLQDSHGALVSHVLVGSPAAKAGFEVGDIITNFNGLAVRENDDLPLMVADTPVNTSVKIQVIRAGKEMILNSVIEKLNEKTEIAQKGEQVNEKFDDLGLVVKDLTEDLATVFKITKVDGALIQAVKPGSLAERSGFARGDIIQGLQIKGRSLISIKDSKSFYENISGFKTKEAFLLLVRRIDSRASDQSTTLYLTLNPK